MVGHLPTSKAPVFRRVSLLFSILLLISVLKRGFGIPKASARAGARKKTGWASVQWNAIYVMRINEDFVRTPIVCVRTRRLCACRPHKPRALRTQHGSSALRTACRPHGPSALRTPHEPRALSAGRLFEDDHVGDALSGASCGFSTLNPYGGWGSLFNRMAGFRKGAACNALAARRIISIKRRVRTPIVCVRFLSVRLSPARVVRIGLCTAILVIIYRSPQGAYITEWFSYGRLSCASATRHNVPPV